MSAFLWWTGSYHGFTTLTDFFKMKKKKKKKCFAALKMCLLDEGHGENGKNRKPLRDTKECNVFVGINVKYWQ